MEKTVGNVERLFRVALALGALIAAAAVGFWSGWGVVFVILAAVLAATGSSGYCPIYSATGVDTLSKGRGGTDQRP